MSGVAPLEGLPDGVIGFRFDGKLHAADYKDTLVPAIDDAVGQGQGIRIVLVFKDFDGVSGDAVWEDLKASISHLKHWKRIALVTDIDWMRHMTTLFGWMTPGELKRFPTTELDSAIAWAASD